MAFASLNIRLKFIAGLVLFTLLLGFCLSIIMYFHFNSIMKSEISQRARMLLAQSNAVQDYVKTTLRPEMFSILPEGRFILKAMSSSYISREIMDRISITDDITYHYRRVARNARNRDSSPSELESTLINYFRQHQDLRLWENDTLVGNEEYHLIARPITFTESCMSCHGDPEDAPGELLEIYGDKGGFHYTVGEVGGVVVAGFPVAMITNPAKEVTLQYISLYLLGILFFASLISLFFDRLVMKNLHSLGQIFKTRFSGEQEQGIIEKLEKKDEIEGLMEGVDELAVCLSDARKSLEDYAQNLESKVRERTQDLNIKAEKHHGDVRLFVTMLTLFAGSVDIRELLPGILEGIGLRYSADQVIYHCTVVSENYYCWQEESRVTPLPPEVKDILWTDEILPQENRLYIPVKSHDTHHGILVIVWQDEATPDDMDPAVLLALGQQVGILIENIQAISNMRFQKDMLQSVIEGISDPLLLIDTDCRVLMANQGSRRILQDLPSRDQAKELKKFLGIALADNATATPGKGRASRDILAMTIETGEPANHEIRSGDGRHFRISLYPLPCHDASSLRMVLYARDITMEVQMTTRMQQAERLSAIGKMAAGIAHEINNPLGVIQCYADLVKDALEDQEAAGDVDVILRQTRTVRKVVRDLLNLARPKQVISGQCSINRVVADAMDLFKAQAASKSIRLESALQEGLPAIKCDAAILEQILTNIWLNAFDALQEMGGLVTISTSQDIATSDIVLCVEDNGPGIPGHALGQIFDPFYTTKEVGKGTGLGLSVVYGFVTELGGRIEVTSDATTNFCIYFPAAGPKDGMNE